MMLMSFGQGTKLDQRQIARRPQASCCSFQRVLTVRLTYLSASLEMLMLICSLERHNPWAGATIEAK